MAYTAIVLDERDQEALAQRLGIPAGWEKVCHHMTLHMGPHAPETDPPLGARFELLVHQAGGNGLVTAVMVKTNAKTVNALPHVTVAVNRKEGGRPVMSNKITNWKNITPLTLHGRVVECA